MKIVSKNIIIPSGDNSFEADWSFVSGYNIIAVMSKFISGDSNKGVDVEILNSHGSTIIDPMDVRFYEKSTDGFKIGTAVPFPPGIESNLGISVKAKAEANVSADTKYQMVFFLEKGKAIDIDGKVKPQEEVINNCKI